MTAEDEEEAMMEAQQFHEYEEKITQVIKECLDFIKMPYDKIEVHVKHDKGEVLTCMWLVRPTGTEGALSSSFAFEAKDNLDEARGVIIIAIGLATHPFGNAFNFVQQALGRYQLDDPSRNSLLEVLLREEIARLYQIAQHPNVDLTKEKFIFNHANAAGVLAFFLHLDQNINEFFHDRIEIARADGKLRHLPKGE